MSVDTYHCRRCGAQFGIAGESTGSLEDIEADEFYAGEVAYHEGAHCPALPGTKGRWTPKRTAAIREQRAHGDSIREALRQRAAKVQQAIAKRRREKAETAEPGRPVQYVVQHRGQSHDERRRRFRTRLSDHRYNAREERREERARILAEAGERGIPGTLVALPPMRRWDDGAPVMTRSGNVPHVNPARDSKPAARLRKELRG